MKKISQTLTEIVDGNELLKFGLQQRLLNLSQCARFLQTQVESRAKRKVELSALTMALSRLQKEMDEARIKTISFPKIVNMTVHSNLLIRVFAVSTETRKSVNLLYNKVQTDSGYITVSEGISEVSIITSEKYAEYIGKTFASKPIYHFENVSSLAVKFGPSFFETAGVFNSLVQQLYFQNINILEMSSAGTEFILYMKEEDIRLAFDTIYKKMSLNS